MNNIPNIPNIYPMNASEYPPININNFNYIEDEFDRMMLQNAFQAITETNTWEFIEKNTQSFTFSMQPELNIIHNKMIELGYSGHSGSSFGCILRSMQYYIQNGEEQFKLDYK